jgi:hypothetical protein
MFNTLLQCCPSGLVGWLRVILKPLLLFVLCVFAFQMTPISAQSFDPPNPFGVVEGFWMPEEACALGVGWERIIFDWSQIQPTGPDDWNTLNVDAQWLRDAQACDREVVAIVKHTPQWATDGLPNAGVPRGLSLPLDEGGNLWATFMRRAAEYYAPLGVHRWIIWNEPDITRETYGFIFEGTVEDYARMVRVAALAARQSDPDARIHLAGMTYWHDVNAGRRLYLDRLLEILTADPDAPAHGIYFDAVTLHIYYRTETVWQIVTETRALLDRYGLGDKAIWINETNASPNLDPDWRVERPNWQITLDQQAAFLVQAAALGLAGGADAIAVYKLNDFALPPGGESFGILRPDGTPRPAYTTWGMIVREFGGVTGGTFARSQTLDVVRLDAGERQIVVAWARSGLPVQVRIGAPGEEAQLADQYGMMMPIRPVDGEYTLTLPGALCNAVDGCAVGGNPAILIQPAGDVQIMEITPSGETRLQFESEG